MPGIAENLPFTENPLPAPTRRDIDALIEQLKRKYRARITDELVMPASAGSYAAFPEALDARLKAALITRGISRLYSHQRAAWEHIAAGRHTVVVTPTASGKTLCYNLPVLDAAMRDRTKALYLFPTKALAQDQVAEILDINNAGSCNGSNTLGIRAYTFDGDTPGDARKAVRTKGDIVVSNPDMLHQGILPHHTKWAQFFEDLRFVVIDEMHTYRGVFGSHMANVIRRLKRVCAFYGTNPQFIFCSATIANPQELAQALLGADVAAVTESGAPRGKKHLLLWNPPVINADLGLRASNRSQTTRIARTALRDKLKTIVFANSRLMVEVITKYMKDVFDKDPRRPARVAAYRGGYLPTARRATEKQLRADGIDCVVTTNALELGVDIGSLDICLLNGYPGTIAATWQRLGRAGRRNRTSLGVLIASSEPLDQYIVRNPEFFLGASPEHARIAADQLLILMDHVRCAAFELPFRQGETFGGENLAEMLNYLVEQGLIHKEGAQWHWMADSYPANSVSLRSIAEGNFVVVDTSNGKQDILAEVDFASVPMTLYEGAIYLIQARPWQVERLDWAGRKAFVKETQADYYTDAIEYTKLKILDEFESAFGGDISPPPQPSPVQGEGAIPSPSSFLREGAPRKPFSRCARGEVHLVRRIPGYKKIRYYTHENVGYGNIHLPDQEMHTTAVWWQIAPEVLAAFFASHWQALDGFLGAAYALHFVAALLTMSEKSDLGRAVGDSNATWFATVGVDGRGSSKNISGEAVDVSRSGEAFIPTVFLYDNYPGGIGLSTPLYDLRQEVVRQAVKLVENCACRHGCPACVGPILTSDEERGHSPKTAAAKVLSLFGSGA
jgi:DEAD/DEAH box helicase domain-containing protein